MFRKVYIIIFVATIVLAFTFRITRTADSPSDEVLAKQACGIERAEDGRWKMEDLDELFPQMSWWSLPDTEQQVMLDLYNHLWPLSISSAGAAQLNPRWRELAEAQIELMTRMYHAYLLRSHPSTQRDSLIELQYPMYLVRNTYIAECIAFQNRLNK